MPGCPSCPFPCPCPCARPCPGGVNGSRCSGSGQFRDRDRERDRDRAGMVNRTSGSGEETGGVGMAHVIRMVWLLAVLLLGLPSAAPAAQHRPPQRTAEEWARIYNDPARDVWQKPEEVLKALELRPDEVVADIGT